MDCFYSVVVRANENRPMLDDRMLEGVAPDIQAKFLENGKPNLIELSKYPAILTSEYQDDDTTTMAVIGYMDEPSMNPHISCPIMRFPALTLRNRGILGERGGFRTRWMVFKGDPYKLLAGICCDFGFGAVALKEHQVAVMMPFNNEASIDPVYRAMEAGAKDAGYSCVRVDQLVTPTVITDDIRKLITESRVVIADVSGLNSNVMYELGFAHGKDKQVILVSSDQLDNLPFDISANRVFSYQKTDMGLRSLSKKIARSLKSI